MKRLLLTVAVTTLAISPAFANKVGGGNRPGSRPVTETKDQKETEQRKAGQAKAAGTVAKESSSENQAREAISSSGVRFSTLDSTAAAKNLAEAMKDNAVKTTVETLVKNSSNEAARTSLETIAELARQGLLSSADGKGVLKFIETQIVTEIVKGNDSVTSVRQMVLSLSEVISVLKESANAGKSVDVRSALEAGIKRAFPKKTQKEIDEILCKCFGICR